MFLEVATESLWRRIEQLVDFLRIIKASHLLLGFDGRKQPMLLMNKGRVADATADATLSKKKIGKMLGLMRKSKPGSHSYARTEGAPSDQLCKLRNNMSDMLHRTESGRELTRLLVQRVMTKVKVVLPHVVIDLVESTEADSLVQNSWRSFQNGKLWTRPVGWRVGIMANDLDVCQELRMRPASEFFVQFPAVTKTRLDLRNPIQVQVDLLKEKVHRFSDELPVDALVIRGDGELSWYQRFAIWLLWLVRGTDYELKGAKTKGLLDVAGKTVRMKVLWRGFRAFHGVIKRGGDMTFVAFVEFLRNPEMLIDKLDEIGEDTRAQLAGAFELDWNLRQMFYTHLARDD